MPASDLRNTKVFSVFERFHALDWSRFDRFIHSPYFNQSEELIRLYELCHKLLKGNGQRSFSKEEAWKKIKKGHSYDDVRMRKYLSDLLKLVEQYLAQAQFEEDDIRQSIYLLQAIGDRQIAKLERTGMRTVRKNLEKMAYRTPDYYLSNYEAEINLYNLVDFETNREEKSNIEAISNNLDYFYLGEKLRILSNVSSRKKVIQHDYQLGLIEEIIKTIDLKKYESNPTIAIYYQIYLVNTDPSNEDHYFKLKELLEQHYQLFPSEEVLNTLYAAAQNYCIFKINRGQQNFLKELFDVYKSILDKGFYSQENTMTPSRFRNMVVTGLRLKEFTWVEEFIQKYQEFLPERFRENAVSFNLAQLYFYQKKYEKVISILQQIEYEDFTYNLNSKVTLLFTYYEMDEVEPLFSLLDSFSKYLNRHKEIPTNRRLNYQNLIRFTRKLTNVMPGDKPAIDKLKKEISETKVASVNWLKEKIAELE